MDYRQTSGSATSWRRARAVQISNDRGATPSVSFSEEDVVVFNGVELRTPAVSTVVGMFDPSAVIPLVDPATGALTGQTATQTDLYVIMHSLYLQLAKKRDDAAASPTPGP